MRSFFKIFFACLIALIVGSVLFVVFGVKLVQKSLQSDKPEVKSNSVLVLDLSKPITEQRMTAGIDFPEGRSPEALGLFDLIRTIKKAENDSAIKGIYLLCADGTLGYAGSTELRNQLASFKNSGRFIIAAAPFITQRAYQVANVSNNIYCMPQGSFEWNGFATQMIFFKKAFDKLEIQPEIFYAGQFKSATEMFRLEQMSDLSRLQMSEYLGDVYSQFLQTTAAARRIDTATLRRLASNLNLNEAWAAAKSGLIDVLKYDDEVKAEIRKKLGIAEEEKINFLQAGEYMKTADWYENRTPGGSNQVALIYAEGEIVDGNATDQQIGGERYASILRQVRLDKNIKAVVIRINSPGGSGFASEQIWREITLCRKAKPVVVSMGDYGASGGYYIASAADSIFAQPNTLTGSIGVFTMLFNAQALLSNKLGITFDVVKTAPYADYGTITRPMTPEEKSYTQSAVDSFYSVFKQKVADGRHMSLEAVENVAQGRIWSGSKALEIKLVDRLGGLQDAIDCAARMAKLDDYTLREAPEVKSLWQKLFGEGDNATKNLATTYALKETFGEEEYTLLKQYQSIKNWSGIPQMRLPFFSTIR